MTKLVGKMFRGHSESILVSLVLLLLTSGCSGTAPHPDDALGEYIENVRENRADAVYDSLGDDLRAGRSREEFRIFFEENHEEILSQAEAIESAVNADKMEIVAALPVGEHAEVTLEYQNARWFLVDDVPAVAGTTSPRGTLVALAEAVETKDLGAILLLLSKEKSDTLSAELNIVRSGLENVSEDDIIINGDVATVFLDWGLKLELVFEDGTWRLQRLTQQ